MQQIFNVALDIDTEGIERRIVDKAEQTIIDRMYANVEKKFVPNNWERDRYYRDLLDKAADKFLEEHKEEIISQIAQWYVDWAKRSPKVRDAVKEAGTNG